MTIHQKLISEYQNYNRYKNGLLERCASTLIFEETIKVMDQIYKEFGLYERIMVAVTGSKMQTLGLILSKIKYPDLHLEYPSPDSYYLKGFSFGIQDVHQVVFSNFKELTRL
jgi:hypothetical protein